MPKLILLLLFLAPALHAAAPRPNVLLIMTDDVGFGASSTFGGPIPTPTFTVSLLWHPRLDAGPAHRWLRGCVRDICTPWFVDSPASGESACT